MEPEILLILQYSQCISKMSEKSQQLSANV